MPIQTQPNYEKLRYGEEGEKIRYKKQEAVYLQGANSPAYVVAPDRIHTTDHYLCIRTTDGPGSHESETHKIPHSRIRRREYVVTEAPKKEPDDE